MTSIFELKEELAEGCSQIYQQKLVKLGEGNVSLRISNRSEMVISPSGNNYRNPMAEEMVHLDFKGKNYDPSLTPSSEFRMHRYIYEQRPKVQCILHTHSPYACALAVTQNNLPVIIEEMALFLGGPVNCADFASAGSVKLPQFALKAMKNRNAVLLANHGLLVVGKTMEQCIKTAIIVEKMAKIYSIAVNVGQICTISKSNQKKFIELFNEQYSTV